MPVIPASAIDVLAPTVIVHALVILRRILPLSSPFFRSVNLSPIVIVLFRRFRLGAFTVPAIVLRNGSPIAVIVRNVDCYVSLGVGGSGRVRPSPGPSDWCRCGRFCCCRCCCLRHLLIRLRQLRRQEGDLCCEPPQLVAKIGNLSRLPSVLLLKVLDKLFLWTHASCNQIRRCCTWCFGRHPE